MTGTKFYPGCAVEMSIRSEDYNRIALKFTEDPRHGAGVKRLRPLKVRVALGLKARDNSFNKHVAFVPQNMAEKQG